MTKISIAHLDDEYEARLYTKFAIASAIAAKNHLFFSNPKDADLFLDSVIDYRCFGYVDSCGAELGFKDYYKDVPYADINILDLSMDTIGISSLQPIDDIVDNILKRRHSEAWILISSNQLRDQMPFNDAATSIVENLWRTNTPRLLDVVKEYSQIGSKICSILREIALHYFKTISDGAWLDLYQTTLYTSHLLPTYVINDSLNNREIPVRNLLIGWGDISRGHMTQEEIRSIVFDLLEKTHRNPDYNSHHLSLSRLHKLQFNGKWRFIPEDLSMLPFTNHRHVKHLISYWKDDKYISIRKAIDYAARDLTLEILSVKERMNELDTLRRRSGKFPRSFRAATKVSRATAKATIAMSPSATDAINSTSGFYYKLIARRASLALHYLWEITKGDNDLSESLANVLVAGKFEVSDTTQKAPVFSTHLGLNSEEIVRFCNYYAAGDTDHWPNFLWEELRWFDKYVATGLIQQFNVNLSVLRSEAIALGIYDEHTEGFTNRGETDYFSDITGAAEFTTKISTGSPSEQISIFQNRVKKLFGDIYSII